MPPVLFIILVLVALRCCVEITRCPPRRRREHPEHFQQRVSRINSSIPEHVLAQEGEVPVQVDCQIVQGGGGADAVFVGDEADVREPIQEMTTMSATPASLDCNRLPPRSQS